MEMGMSGLCICIIQKLRAWRKTRRIHNYNRGVEVEKEGENEREDRKKRKKTDCHKSISACMIWSYLCKIIKIYAYICIEKSQSWKNVHF